MTLLTPLKDASEEYSHSVERSSCQIKDVSQQFCLPFKSRNYQRQYFHVYSHRLAALRERVAESAKDQLGAKAIIKRLSDLDEIDRDQNVVVIGTLFKTQMLKPNILKEVGEETATTNENNDVESLDKYIDEADELVLEDELQRARLYFGANDKGLKEHQFVTGIVCGILGSMIPSEESQGGGKFRVENIFLPTLPPIQKPFSKPEKEDKFVAFLSGIEISGSTNADCLAALEMASSFITGEIGDVEDQNESSKIVKLIVAGNSLASETKDKKVLSTAKYLTSGQTARSVEAVMALDKVMEQFSSGLDVDVMPGENDPANQNLPQQPLHCCLFPKAKAYNSLKTVPNPYMLEIDGHLILGTSGQNINDVLRNCSMTDPLDALEAVVKWSHIAPTCPDTLGSFPFEENDPFVIDRLPRILFAGNQEEFTQRTLSLKDNRKVLLITLPKFSQSKTIVLLNLKTMQCQPLKFECK